MIARMKHNRAQRKSQKGKFKGHLEGKYESVSKTEGLKIKEVDPETYEAWKTDFLAKKKAYRSKMTKRFLILVLLAGLLAFLVRLWAKDELQFLFYKTEFTTAEVYEVKWYHWGRGKYFQNVFYTFKHEGEDYSGHFRAGQSIGKMQEGDLVKVKFAPSNPDHSKYEARLVRLENN